MSVVAVEISGISVDCEGCSGMSVDAEECSGMSVDAEGFSGMCVQSLVMKVGQKCFPSVWLLILHKLTRLIKI